ncbi:MAG: VOC family protein [Acidimicrobiales bacterium]
MTDTLRLGSTVINCADIEAMSAFWCAALDLTPESTSPDDMFRILRGKRARLSLQRARTPITARDQMHLDLYIDDAAAKTATVERLVGLGAEWVRASGIPDDDYEVLRDPEGNEFCVCLVDPGD